VHKEPLRAKQAMELSRIGHDPRSSREILATQTTENRHQNSLSRRGGVGPVIKSPLDEEAVSIISHELFDRACSRVCHICAMWRLLLQPLSADPVQ
jgi:hypothetical protein